jgi:adenylate kinase
MKTIVLLGSPGAGKGTAADKIEELTGFQHISTGDMLREAVKRGTAIGVEAEDYMERGALVPDDVMMQLVEERIAHDSVDTAYMFDGFPRTDRQATLLEDLIARRGGTLVHVFSLEAPREVLISRLTGRRICRNCGANFHMVNIPPRVAGICDACGGELYQRADDQEATIIVRLEIFNTQTAGLVARYEQEGHLVRIDSDCGVDAMVEQIIGMLK